MVFSSMTFLFLFLPILYILYFISRNINWKNGLLLVASLIFYAWGEPVWIIAMLIATGINYLCALAFCSTGRKGLRRLLLAVGVVASIAFLAYFKYAAFFVNSFTSLFGIELSLPVLELPIGISFYTFQVLTYTVDVYRGKAQLQKNPFLLLLYVCCFPQLIAGPIVQYSDVEQMLRCRTETREDFAAGMHRFVIGLGKKVLLANVCGEALTQTTLASADEAMSLAGAWCSIILFALQIYFDFSAYSDMAIGLGQTLGFTYKENFNYPYISLSISEFWRRWHISLGAFFRDYVYIPMGGNRVSRGRLVLNLLVVWALTGLWHGASWNFVAWGAYYGVLIVCERLFWGKALEKLPRVLRLLYTLVLVLVGWVFFYYEDISLCGEHLLAMVGVGVTESGLSMTALVDNALVYTLKQYAYYLPVAVIACLPVCPAIKRLLAKNKHLEAAGNILSTLAMCAILALSVAMLISSSYNPFLYFRF